jgi:hypothetical protein
MATNTENPTSTEVESTDDPPSWDGNSDFAGYFSPEVVESPKFKKFSSGLSKLKSSVDGEKSRYARLFETIYDRTPNENEFEPPVKEDPLEVIMKDDAMFEKLLSDAKAMAKIEGKLTEFPKFKAEMERIRKETEDNWSTKYKDRDDEANFIMKFANEYEDHAHNQLEQTFKELLCKARPDLVSLDSNNELSWKDPKAEDAFHTMASAWVDASGKDFHPNKLLIINRTAVEPAFQGLLNSLSSSFPPPKANSVGVSTGSRQRTPIGVNNSSANSSGGHQTYPSRTDAANAWKNFIARQ